MYYIQLIIQTNLKSIV